MLNNKPLAKRLVINGVECRLVKGFGQVNFNLPDAGTVAGIPKAKAVRAEDGRIIDYQDLKGQGYVTTWSEDVTGESSQAEAFTKELIAEYMQVPMLMMDHGWGCSSVAGSVTGAEPDLHGCKIDFAISNAPDLCSLRFKIAEGHCKTLSISGYASMDEVTGKYTMLRWIESSIVAIPANRECTFAVTDGDPVVAGTEEALPSSSAKANQEGKTKDAPEKLAAAALPAPAPETESADEYEVAQGLKLAY